MTFQELMDCYYISDVDCDQNVYNMLLSQIKKQNVTPVIGAGLSFWAYPGWGRLLKESAMPYGEQNAVQRFLDQNRYDDAAEYLEKVIGTSTWQNILQKAFHPSLIKEKQHERPCYQKAIPRLFQGPILTTNFDRAIEDLYGTLDAVNPSDDFQSDRLKRAQQQKTPLLIKMHGDIMDSKNLVLTTSQYDKFYGDDRETPNLSNPLPKFLAETLGHNPLLFLGCSLGPDRTCAVIRGCVNSDTHFALLPLPNSTKNTNDPLKPKLKTRNKLRSQLLKRRAELSKMNVIPIWYPCGNDMHDDALSAFFSQLERDLGIYSGVKTDFRYAHTWNLVGRHKEINTIIKLLDTQQRRLIWVEGPTGIGKTEVCKAVNNMMQLKYQNWNMPFIDVSNVDCSAAFFDRIAKEANISLTEPVNEWANLLLKRLVHRYINPQGSHIPTLYFDNFEDVLGIVEIGEKTKIINWIRELNYKGFSLLFSSQSKPPAAIAGNEVTLMPLDNGINVSELTDDEFLGLDSVGLFCDIWGCRPASQEEMKNLRTLVGNLEGHPLAVILTASQARESIFGLAPVLEKWEQASQVPYGDSYRHTSLKTALMVAWESVRSNNMAVLYWVIQYYSIQPIPNCLHDDFCDNISKADWREGVQSLSKFSLLQRNPDTETTNMLLPLKVQLPFLLSSNDPCFEQGLLCWAVALCKLLDKTYEFRKMYYQTSHDLIVSLLPQLFHIMKSLLDYNSPKTVTALYALIYNSSNYFQWYLPSVEILEELIQYPVIMENVPILAHVNMCYGDLLFRMSEWSKAEEILNRAEQLFISEDLKDGLANTLRLKGDLLSFQGKNTEAQHSYDQAECIFSSLSDKLGVAYTVHMKGELLSHLGKLNDAFIAFDRAENIFREEKDNLGLGNVLQSKGRLMDLLDDSESAMKLFDNAESLFRKEHAILGMATTLQSRCDLLNHIGKFRDAINISVLAESNFQRMSDRLGLAYTFCDRGESLLGMDQPYEATDCCHRAQDIFLQLGDKLGLADVYRLQGNIEMYQKDYLKAKSHFEKAIDLYHGEEAQIELAYGIAIALQFIVTGQAAIEGGDTLCAHGVIRKLQHGSGV